MDEFEFDFGEGASLSALSASRSNGAGEGGLATLPEIDVEAIVVLLQRDIA